MPSAMICAVSNTQTANLNQPFKMRYATLLFSVDSKQILEQSSDSKPHCLSALKQICVTPSLSTAHPRSIISKVVGFCVGSEEYRRCVTDTSS